MNEKLVKITNEPISTEMRANTSRKVRIPVKVERAADWVSWTSVSPVTTSTSVPSRAWATVSFSSAWPTPSSASMAIRSTWPGTASRRWAVAESNSVTEVPAGLSAVPKRAIPTSVACCTPDCVWNDTVSPTA
jgi:hypothetical protein